MSVISSKNYYNFNCCRTCEVFSVSELVINSLNVVQRTDFTGISASAEVWMPMREVNTQELPTYLMSMKRNGFTLVGVEQTARSISLSGAQFPSKTVLLLGNEKEGIPAELLAILDWTCEIPQAGVIRYC